MTFEQVDTEYATGIIFDAHYGSKVRIIMRSPEYVMFVGYGVNLSKRSDNGRTTLRLGNSKKETFQRDDIRAKIVSRFGEGADEEAIKAITTRGKGTILVDGGGEALPLPYHVQKKITQDRYDSITPTKVVQIDSCKKCLQCSKPLRMHTVTHHLGNIPQPENHPMTVEDCQKLTNQPVVNIAGYGINKPSEWWPYISWFETWDGESYEQETFCSVSCAATYGYRAAAELPHLVTGGKAPVKKKLNHESIQHNHKPEPEQFIELADGTRLRV